MSLFRRRERERGWVYGIRSGEYIKIGFTRSDPAKRLKDLQTGNPIELELLFSWWSDDVRRLESDMHEILKAFHHKLEWFRIKPSHAEDAYRQATGSLAIFSRLRARWHWVTRAVGTQAELTVRALVRSGAVLSSVGAVWGLQRVGVFGFCVNLLASVG